MNSLLRNCFIVLVFMLSANVFAGNNRNKGRIPMASINNRNVILILPGMQFHLPESFINKAEIGYAHHHLGCDGIIINQGTFVYEFSSSFKNYGLRYQTNIAKAFVAENTMIYPFLSFKTSYFEAPKGDGYIVEPGLGVSFTLNRKKNPFITIDLFYGYSYEVERKNYLPFDPHTFNGLLGFGIVW